MNLKPKTSPLLRLRFWVWLMVVSLVCGSAVSLLDCWRRIDNGQAEFNLASIIERALTFSAVPLVICGIVSLKYAPWKKLFRCLRDFFGWLFSWRMAKRGLKALGILLCLLPVLYLEEDLRGKLTWNIYRHGLEAKGESFDFKDFIPKPVPGEQNFALP